MIQYYKRCAITGFMSLREDSVNKSNWKVFLCLHLMLMVYSTSSICSKLAAEEKFLSFRFCLYYIAIIALLGFYAIGWQQIIKRLPLTTAFANKAVTVVWGIIWGFVFFAEPITVRKVIGALLVIAGVVTYAKADVAKTDVIKTEAGGQNE